jgi:hypothetical protein
MNMIARLHEAVSAVAPIEGVSVTGNTVRIDFLLEATPAQRTQAQAIVDAFDWSPAADTRWLAQQAKQRAAAQIDAGDTAAGDDASRALRALALMVLDEFNAHRTVEAAMFAAIDAASSLADLKTRMAAVQQVPQRTPAQLIAAIKAKINATPEWPP